MTWNYKRLYIWLLPWCLMDLLMVIAKIIYFLKCGTPHFNIEWKELLNIWGVNMCFVKTLPSKYYDINHPA